jgi:L,D-transpeptidase YcbB
VIVGKASGKKVKAQGRLIGENHTPTLVSKINQVIFNPRWYVSDRISLELDVEASKDPNYFDRLGYVRMASTYPWGAPRLYQRPGPYNPLGRVKFEFPNPYAVFLHDTPKKQLFLRARRDFSHGCLRLEGAVGFAQMLLKDDQHPTADKTDQYLADNQQKHIELQHPVPIVIEYAMASSDASGHIVFCGDPYSWFEKLG